MNLLSLENQSQVCKEAGDLAAPDGINQNVFPSLMDVVYTAQASPER